jgi:hypothetical protein
MSASRTLGRSAIVSGVLAVLAVPAAIAAAQVMSNVTLLRALYVGAPVSVALGLIALLLVRRARLAASRSVAGGGPLRTSRVVAWAGLYVGVTAAIALGVYAILEHAG